MPDFPLQSYILYLDDTDASFPTHRLPNHASICYVSQVSRFQLLAYRYSL